MLLCWACRLYMLSNVHMFPLVVSAMWNCRTGRQFPLAFSKITGKQECWVESLSSGTLWYQGKSENREVTVKVMFFILGLTPFFLNHLQQPSCLQGALSWLISLPRILERVLGYCLSLCGAPAIAKHGLKMHHRTYTAISSNCPSQGEIGNDGHWSFRRVCSLLLIWQKCTLLLSTNSPG